MSDGVTTFFFTLLLCFDMRWFTFLWFPLLLECIYVGYTEKPASRVVAGSVCMMVGIIIDWLTIDMVCMVRQGWGKGPSPDTY